MDSGRAPLRVFLAHPLNEIAQATINFRPPCPLSGFPAPESFEAYAMPSQDRLRLNHLGRAKQARPEPCHPYQQCPVNPTKSKTRRRMPQCDVEWMTEEKILDLKPAPRLEQVGDEHSERVQDCKHRHQRCDDSTLLCESRPDGIFGKDNLLDRRKSSIQLDKEPAIIVRQPDAAMYLTSQNDQLMSKNRILCLKSDLRLEWRGHKSNE